MPVPSVFSDTLQSDSNWTILGFWKKIICCLFNRFFNLHSLSKHNTVVCKVFILEPYNIPTKKHSAKKARRNRKQGTKLKSNKEKFKSHYIVFSTSQIREFEIPRFQFKTAMNIIKLNWIKSKQYFSIRTQLSYHSIPRIFQQRWSTTKIP